MPAGSNAGRAPLPGRPVRGSARGRPIMALLDLLGRRWALRILWELHQRELSFGELQAACDGMSTSVLSSRLGELAEAGIVRRRADGRYSLTAPGRRLVSSLEPLSRWAGDWARRTALGRRT